MGSKSELLQKIEELNTKLEQLSRQELAEQHGEQIKALVPGKQTEVFSLDFIDSDKLEEIERGIKETVRGVILSKTAICKSLANIDRKKLYKQAGAHSFMDYLSSERIPIKYKTAKEYAKIGDILIRYGDQLSSVHFKEEDGLKKLMYLEKALERHENDPGQVFDNITRYSLRAFKEYAMSRSEQIEESGEEEPTENLLPSGKEREAEPVEYRSEGNHIVRTSASGERTVVLSVDEAWIAGLDEDTSTAFMNELRAIAEQYDVISRDNG
jgi:hypothetical protein